MNLSVHHWLGILLLSWFSITAHAQQQAVSGTVTADEEGALPGVNILVKGTTQGTVTDIDGNYRINVSGENAVLVFSAVGYTSQEVAVSGRSTINVVMPPDVQSLDEIVVVGFGTQKKADVTGSVGSIPAEEIAAKPITSPDQVLGGRVSGVQISNRSGDPGAPINVRIRGIGTAGANQPLWVIDGVPIVQTSNITVNTGSNTETNPLAGINPNDIQSIDVLKDAASAAIYGARAANGVIIVTTKRGTAGRTSVTYDGYVGVQTVPESRRIDVLNVDQYIDLQTEIGRDVTEFGGQPFVDWQDAIFKNGPMQSHNITTSGGSEKINFSVSAGYLSQEGIEPAQDFERYSFKANSDIKVGKNNRFTFGESILISFVDRLVQSESGAFAAFNASLNAPYFKIYNPDGPFGYNPENPTTVGEGRGENYVYRTDLNVNETRVRNKKVLGNIYGQWEILDGLSYKISAGIDYNVGDGFFYQAPVSFSQIGDPRLSLLVQSRPIELTTNIANTLTYTKTFGQHNLTVLVGHEETNFRFDKIRIQGSNLFNTAVRFASVASTLAAGNEADQWALRGYLGRINYSFANKYLATVNVRRDATSRFAKGNRSDVFPSASIGWRLSEESFFPETSFIDDLKIRAGWGQSGNQFTGLNFAFISSLNIFPFYVIGANQNIIRAPVPTNFANPDLVWETSTQTDIGLDAAFWEGRIELTFDYYNKTTDDVLLGLPIPAVSGFFLPTDANIGQIKNSGIEIALTYNNRIGDFDYSIGGNLTTVHNEVTDLGDPPLLIITGVGGGQTHRTTVGESLGHFYGFKTDGIFQSEDEIDAAPIDALSADRQPGDIRFADVNGDNVVDNNDRTILGSPIPDFYYGINLSAGWKGFDFSALLQGVGGMQVYNAARINFESMNGGNNQSTRVLDRWTPENPSTIIPRATQDDPNGNNRFSDRWVEDADYLRIRNLQIGYRVPSTVLESLTEGFVSNVRVYVGAQNLATFTKYLGFDPEVTRGFSFQKGEFPLATGQDSGGSPQPRIFQLGAQVTF
uniref:TonB-dependent receptor n=1 Tax=Roseihalotalea indica TaxID=2867963 RepID=A0AA49JHV0_9BACT|nr:TonB-dependent receptor [Tunicatimonas sp. TK19036]